METIRKNIQASWQKINVPPQPLNCAAIPVLEQTFKETENDEIIVAFSSRQANPFTSNSRPWFGDGTFKVWPNIFF